MKRSIALLSILLFCGSVQADHSDAYADVYAARQMRSLDKDGNGRFEKEESSNDWKRKQQLDADKDGVLTLEELKLDTISYLETPSEKKLNILYKRTPEEDLYLDLYYPTGKRTGKCPVIIYTHGGGWTAGSKQGAGNASFAVVFKALVDQGFAVAAVNYRLYRKGGAVAMRDCVIDSKDAIRYLTINSSELGIDPQRVYSFGDSAGGQISQMLLLSSPESLPGDPALADASYKMVAGVSWYGPCDFEKTSLFNHDDRENFRDRFGPRVLLPDTDPKDKQVLYQEMSPINYLTENSPPLLMIQGDKDTTIPVKHADYMQEKAAAAGAPVEIMIIKNAGHNWRKVDTDIDPSRDAIIDRTVRFFVEHL